MKQNFHNILSQNFIATIEWQIFHNILSKYFITTTSSQIIWETIYIFHDVMNDAISHYKILFNDEYNIYHNNWVTDTSSQNFHKFFDNIHYHNILRQPLKWQIINRCINEVSQQSISMLNYSTSLLQYLHLNYWVTDSSSDYETVMKQFFITKHLITEHLITTSTNWVTDISQHTFQILHHNKLSDRYFTTYFPNTSSQQLSDRYFIHHTSQQLSDRLFNNSHHIM